jgi:hypothetical protein
MQIIAYFDAKLKSFDYGTSSFDTMKPGSKLKYTLFSAHDDTLAAFLTGLKYLDRKCWNEKVIN